MQATQYLLIKMIYFFMVAQLLVQYVSWMLILGKLHLSYDRRNPSIDVEEKTKSKGNLIQYVFFVIFYQVFNFFVLIFHSIRHWNIVYALLLTLMTYSNITIVIIYYCMNKYGIVVTDDLLENLKLQN